LGHWRWIALWIWPVVFVFRDAFGVSWLTGATWTLVCLALSQLDAQTIRQGVHVAAGCQVPFVLWNLCGGHALWYDGAGSGLWGTVGGRAPLSALFGLCALYMVGKQRLFWFGMTCATGSLVGVIPLLLQWWWRMQYRLWLVVPLLVGGVSTFPLWKVRVLSRLGVWWDVLPQTLIPVGFGTLRGEGFLGDGLLDRLLHWVDYHNMPLEVWARFGWMALPILVGIVVLTYRHCGPWITCWMITVNCATSWMSYPVLAFLVGMALKGEQHGVDTV